MVDWLIDWRIVFWWEDLSYPARQSVSCSGFFNKTILSFLYLKSGKDKRRRNSKRSWFFLPLHALSSTSNYCLIAGLLFCLVAVLLRCLPVRKSSETFSWPCKSLRRSVVFNWDQVIEYNHSSSRSYHVLHLRRLGHTPGNGGAYCRPFRNTHKVCGHANGLEKVQEI